MAPAPPTAETKPRWFQPTPGRVLLLLLAVEAILFLSERYRWFPFNNHKGWTVLIAIATLIATMALLFLWFLVALCFRRRFQFSLRTLMATTVVVAIPFSWLAAEMQKAREQEAAVDALVSVGCNVGYVNELFPDADGRISFEGWSNGRGYGNKNYFSDSILQPVLNRLEELLGKDFFTDVINVRFTDTSATDANVQYVKSLPRLEYLSLANTDVTDDGVECLKGLKYLRKLSLEDTYVSPEVADELDRALPNCIIDR